MTPRDTMLRAAELLHEDAQDGYDACERATDPPQPWACEDCVKDEAGTCNARLAHDERRTVAAGLVALADAFA